MSKDAIFKLEHAAKEAESIENFDEALLLRSEAIRQARTGKHHQIAAVLLNRLGKITKQ